MSTSKWLKAMGAVRPMAVASDQVLVLGEWSQGHYPIQWKRFYDRITSGFDGKPVNRDPIELWYLFGHQLSIGTKLTQDDCERILAQITAATLSESKGAE